MSMRLKLCLCAAIVLSATAPTLPAQKAPVKEPIIQPKKGDVERLSVVRGTIQAYESVRIFAKVSGHLKNQTIDIGSRVKKGEVLAVLDVPELQGQVELDRVGVEQARARVLRAKAAVNTAKAERDALKGAVIQAEANAKSASAVTQMRERQFNRMKDLFAAKTIDARLVDESNDQLETARAAEDSAKAAVATAKAQFAAGVCRIEQAEVEIAVTETDVESAKAKLHISQIRFGAATITAPFDGIITRRDYSSGELIQAAQPGIKPLFTIERTGVMRVVVSVPERDAPFVDPGDAATVEIDAFPGKIWAAKVSRVAAAEDPKTRTMRVELDLPNPDGRLRSGMTATASIVLEKRKTD